jgi:hypothetical protein
MVSSIGFSSTSSGPTISRVIHLSPMLIAFIYLFLLHIGLLNNNFFQEIREFRIATRI